MRMWRAALVVAMGLGLGSGCGSEQAAPKPEPAPDEPEYVEHFPGELKVTAPERGAFIPLDLGSVVTVAGVGASSALTVNGQAVTPDEQGAFSTQVILEQGLNLITVEDGDASIDTPVVHGTFAPLSQAVPNAISVRVNAGGFVNDDPSLVSLSLIAQQALDDADLLAALKGETLTGSIPGGSWKLRIDSATYGDTSVKVAPRDGGAAFSASVHDVKVDGELEIKLLLTKKDDVSITADRVDVDGAVAASLSGSELSGSAENVEASLHGFQYDSDNAGLPCCVDGILTDYLRPKVRNEVQKRVNAIMSKEITFALEQFALPEVLDLSSVGFSAALGIATHLDGASFEQSGVTLSAAAHFTAPVEPSSVGWGAPGWITVAQPMGAMAVEPSFGISVSLDALNQALHAAWAQDGLTRTLEEMPMVDTVLVEPRLPPMVLPNPDGTLSARAGEIVMHATMNDVPFQLAVNVMGDVTVALDTDSQTLTLVPGPAPHVSVTWLVYEGLNEGLREIIKGAILDMVPELLTPIALPLPTLPLGAITPGFEGTTGALGAGTTLGVAAEPARVELYGDLALVATP